MTVRILLTCRLGATNQHDFARCLSKTDEIELYVLTDSVSYPEVPALDHERIRHFHPTWPVIFSRIHPYDKRQYEDVIAEVEPDIVLSCAISHLVFLGSITGFSPTVLLPQGGLVNRSTRKRCKRRNFGPRWLMYRPLVWDLLRHVEEVWTAEPARDTLSRLGMAPEKLRDFDWGVVDTDRFRPNEGVEYEGGQTIIGTFRRARNPPLIPSYRAFLKAVARLRERRDDFHIVLGGMYEGDTGSEVRSAIDESIETHDLDSHVTKLGMVEKSEMPQHYAGLDVYINISPTGTLPGIGTASKEAMACGCPFVTFDDPPTGWIVDHGENGFRFDHDDIEGLTDCLDDLCEEETYRQEIGAKARETVEATFSSEVVGRRVAEYSRQLTTGD